MAAHKGSGRTWIIYGLRRKGETTIRYVGQTSLGLSRRLRGHLCRCHSPELSKWLSGIADLGEEPEAIQLATARSRREANVVEKDWIKSLSFVFGEQLLNYHHRGDIVLLWDLEQTAIEYSHLLREKRIAVNRQRRRLAYENRRIVTTYSHDGRTLTLRQWADRLGITRQRLHQRLQWCERHGRPISEALSTPGGQQMPSCTPGRKRQLAS